MKKKILITSLIILSISSIFSQALPIGMDGTFDDWNDATENYTDTQGDGASYDLLSFSVSNDSTNLFIKFTLDQEIQLNYGNNLYLEIDTDNNHSTGLSINGIGAELEINFGWKDFNYYTTSGNQIDISHSSIKFVALPTVTSDTYEISIGRNVLPDGIHQLFTSNTIKMFFADFNSGGDYMPNSGTFEYTFDNNDVEYYQPISFEKENSSDVRLMTYNTLYDGLTSTSERIAAFQRVITVANPDIITFNECWDTEWYEAKNLLNDWLPISGGTSWECWKVDAGNITCSKYDIVQNYSITTNYYTTRITASKIDLPPSYPRDLIVIAAHLKANNGSSENTQRQAEVDSIISFIHKIKTEGDGIIENIPYGTPFVISGDLNLVGNSQQLNTLLTGEQGSGQTLLPDWDNTNLNNVISFHTDQRMAYTINKDGSSYWPGRIDYAICSDVGATVSKAFTINTRSMSSERLVEYGLNSYDTNIASDHLPKITDFIIEDAVESINSLNSTKVNIFPNPSSTGLFTISNIRSSSNVEVYNILGKIILSKYNMNNLEYTLNLTDMNSGIYFVKIISNNSEQVIKIIKQ